ncbi:CC0125/CC1285 family lipoprotein [Parvularcula maris]|uniref:DUF4136 domain-containing protein n=1 Tax=Parvularcula maris TaxID=2965077 RepID=A0A9X2RJB4_9PROT|nr:hypothetical protein [Parvularcula maris]MCQ8184503.1 hypothetical protein [Parvularcula maris]
MKSPLTLALVGSAALLAACTTATPFKEASKSGAPGYSDVKISSSVYRVSFKGNSQTERETVENSLLFRSAQIAEQNGAPFFQIIDRDVDRQFVENDAIDTDGFTLAGYSVEDPYQAGTDANFHNARFRGGFHGRGFRGRGFAGRGFRGRTFRGGFHGTGFSYYGGGFRGSVSERFEAIAYIRLYGNDPEVTGAVFETQTVLASLRPRITFPKEG